MTILKNLLLAVAFLIATPVAYSADAVGSVTYPTYEELTPVQKNTVDNFKPSRLMTVTQAADFIKSKTPLIAHLLAAKYADKVQVNSASIAVALAGKLPNRVLGISAEIAKVVPNRVVEIAEAVAKVSPGKEALIAGALSKNADTERVPGIASKVAGVIAGVTESQKLAIATEMSNARPALTAVITNALQRGFAYVEPGTAIDQAMLTYIKGLLPKIFGSQANKTLVIQTIKTRPSLS